MSIFPADNEILMLFRSICRTLQGSALDCRLEWGLDQTAEFVPLDTLLGHRAEAALEYIEAAAS